MAPSTRGRWSARYTRCCGSVGCSAGRGDGEMTVIQHVSWGAALVAFGGGLVSFFSPCVAPLVPAYLGYLSGAARPALNVVVGKPSTASLRTSLLFVGGFSVAFVALGLLAASFGYLVVAYRPALETLVGIVMLVMGAFLLVLLRRTWSSLLMREARIYLRPSALGGLGAAGPFALGGLFAAGGAPRIGPGLAALLTYVGPPATPGQVPPSPRPVSPWCAVPSVAVRRGRAP